MTATKLISESIGIIGLGLIGSEWAKNCNSDGILAATWNRTPKPEVPLLKSTPEEVAQSASILHFALSDEKVTLSMIERLLPKLNDSHLVIQSATIDPNTSKKLRALVEQAGARYLEAPFTGSLPAAKERKTVFYLGGDSETIERALSYLSHISARQFHIGDNLQACTLKLVMNLQIVSVLEALVEALTIARSAGISDELFFKAFKENASYSGIAALKEPKLRTDDFSPQFSIKHTAKDMRLLSETLGSDAPPLLKTVREVLAAAEEQGWSEEDISAIIKLRNI